MLRHLALATALLATAPSVLAQAPREVFLDADTANEVDDLYAIVRAFAEPGGASPCWAVRSGQASQWATAETAEDSYRLNQHLGAHLGLGDSTAVVRGAHRRMYDWGHMAVHSHAAHALLEESAGHSVSDPLTVIALGALTNVASALFIDPTLAERIELYWLGSTYDFAADRRGLTDFNAVMDPQAARLVLEHPTLRTHVLPVSEVGQHRVHYDDVAAAIGGKGELADVLLGRWTDHMDGSKGTRVLWDVAIVELLSDPSLGTEVAAPDYGGANVTAYRDLDGERLFARSLARIGGTSTGSRSRAAAREQANHSRLPSSVDEQPHRPRRRREPVHGSGLPPAPRSRARRHRSGSRRGRRRAGRRAQPPVPLRDRDLAVLPLGGRQRPDQPHGCRPSRR